MEKKVQELSFHMKTLVQALSSLEEIFEENYSVIVRDATIQRFEYTFELTWKFFRKVAKIEGIDPGSPRQAIRTAFQVGLLPEVDSWFELLADRNRTSHTYSETTAEQVYESAVRLPALLRPVIEQVTKTYLDEEMP